MRKVQAVKDELREPASLPSASPTPAVDVMLEVIALPAQPFAANRTKKSSPPPLEAAQPGERTPIEPEKLEKAISNAVKKGGPGCENFVGVIVQRTTPKSRFDANWALRGVRFGRANRENADKAISIIVERMQQEFKLPDD